MRSRRVQFIYDRNCNINRIGLQPRSQASSRLPEKKLRRLYSMWSLVRASPRCPWSATFPKMIKYFVEKKNTLNNERYRDLLISILSYDEVSAFLLWVKARN